MQLGRGNVLYSAKKGFLWGRITEIESITMRIYPLTASSSAHLQKVSALFDQWASSDRAHKMADGHSLLMETLLTDISIDCAAKSILDLGCGTGKFLVLAAAAGFPKTAGIDASVQMVRTAQQTASSADIRNGHFESLPWADQSFDQITSIEALYYCPDPAQAFREISRVLKLGGRFDLIIDFYAESQGTASWSQGLGFEIARLSTLEWVAIAQSAGFQTIQSRRIVNPDRENRLREWAPSVWYPTAKSYENYLSNGAFWLAA